MKHINSLSIAFLSVSLLALATGCTEMFPISVNPTGLPPGEKAPMHAVLMLNKDLADYQYHFHAKVYPLGPPLLDYVRHVAGASFQQVDEAPSAEKAFANSSADIVLIPRPVKAALSFKGTGLAPSDMVTFTLVMEWTAKNRASQTTVWLKTITADASEVQGSMSSGKEHQHILMQKLFDDLSIKTREAIQKAPELRGNLH
jgi:hypothetical protein